MLQWFGGLLDRICAVVGALAVSQIPLFIQQYKHQLSGHVAELQIQVDAMRQAASHSGKTLEQFIKKFVDSQDGDFSLQGEIMQSMVSRWHSLSDAFFALKDASLFTKPVVFALHFNPAIAKETMDSFVPGIPLSLEGGVYALIGIGVGYFVFYLVKTAVVGFTRVFIRLA